MPHPVTYCSQEMLEQGERLLRDLPVQAYSAVPPGGGSTIGQHMRHMLDHYQSLMNAERGCVDYDVRHRGSAVETDIGQARALIAQLLAWVRTLDDAALSQPIVVRSEVSLCRTVCAEVGSTIGRELMFLSSHMVHHQAIVALVAKALAVAVEPGLGLAPATRSYLRTVG
ncbi:MAG: hypothetical protein COW59_06695 [Lysobacterales bacterium CG17_big_fil_post_rev_8_21_14_2_50_64_11]|nr:MAG: hypothetical protein COW59_06695 [Xanthomonadales bacterium CG17_big_fil_post_rev_8_21_14_2_50_64_11]PIX60243.1 MAG: hypothetical protein COZ47_08260 [Xanthomonadales bacterium CG_4_10_14_3_um_filter_64_11]